MNSIEYLHLRKWHSSEGPEEGLRIFLNERPVTSLLDVGAGTGTWLRAAELLGIHDFFGIDGVPPHGREIWVDAKRLLTIDLAKPFNLDRNFDVALCLEVAEHLPAASARVFVESICRHSDLVFFSAAVPGQRGQHHVNCQWPEYWQEIFNECGFACHDDVRPRIWDLPNLEPWYKQNVFRAERDIYGAGKEERIRALVHPEMLSWMEPSETERWRSVRIERGDMSLWFYLRLLGKYMRNRLIKRAELR